MPAESLITPQWLSHFESTVFKVGKTQLLSEPDTHRLVALAMAVALMGHQMLSEMGGTPPAVADLRRLAGELGKSADESEGEPPTLSEMTIVMEMASTAYSLIEHRCGQVGGEERDVPTELAAQAFMHVMRRAVTSGGARAAGTLLHVMRVFGRGYRAV